MRTEAEILERLAECKMLVEQLDGRNGSAIAWAYYISALSWVTGIEYNTDWCVGRPECKESRYTAIRTDILQCRRCHLLKSASSNPVPGVGDIRSDIVIVGEAPGKQEEKLGYPFVEHAQAGRVLTDAITITLHRDRSTLFITNAICCRPPSDDPHKQNGKPTDESLTACKFNMDRQLELVNPKAILALGGYASRQLTGTDKVSHALGKLFWYHHWPVIVSWHPSYVARNPNDPERWAQLCGDLATVERIADLPPCLDWKAAVEDEFRRSAVGSVLHSNSGLS